MILILAEIIHINI